MFTVSTRTIDYWRAEGWFPSTKVGGNVRFDVAACEIALTRRFKNLRAVSRQPLREIRTRPSG